MKRCFVIYKKIIMKNFELFLELTRLKKPIGFMLLFWPCLWGLTLAHQFSNNNYIYLKHCILFLCWWLEHSKKVSFMFGCRLLSTFHSKSVWSNRIPGFFQTLDCFLSSTFWDITFTFCLGVHGPYYFFVFIHCYTCLAFLFCHSVKI